MCTSERSRYKGKMWIANKGNITINRGEYCINYEKSTGTEGKRRKDFFLLHCIFHNQI